MHLNCDCYKLGKSLDSSPNSPFPYQSLVPNSMPNSLGESKRILTEVGEMEMGRSIFMTFLTSDF